jgi:hypothetical protein
MSWVLIIRTNIKFVGGFMKSIILFFLSSLALADDSLSNRCIDITFNQKRGMTAREYYNNLNSLNTDEIVLNYIKKPIFDNPWFRMKIPHLHVRTIGFYMSIGQVHGMYGLSSELQPTPDHWLEKGLEFFSPEGLARVLKLGIKPEYLGSARSPLELREIILKPRTYDESGLGGFFKKYQRALSLSCLTFAPFKLKKCKNALNYTFENLYEKGNTYHLGNGWLVDLFLNEQAAPGAFKLIHKMLERIKNKDFEQASFINDAYEAFSFNGVRTNETDRLSETFLLLSLVHGQISWESYRLEGFIQKYNHATMTAALMTSIISAQMDSLVNKYSAHKELYTAFPGITNVCDNGKAYHFIVPWFISRRLRDQGYSKNISVHVPMMFEWGYQNFSTSLGRDPLRNARSAFNSSLNQSHRLDFSFATFGAFLGSGKLNEDKSFEDLFNISQEKTNKKYRPPQKIEGYNMTASNMPLLLKIASERLGSDKMIQALKESE